MRFNRIAAVFYCLIKCRLVQSRQNFRVIESASVAVPLNNRQSGNIVVSDLIAPLKKAQRKSEGGQLFPVNAERANLLARVCERQYS